MSCIKGIRIRIIASMCMFLQLDNVCINDQQVSWWPIYQKFIFKYVSCQSSLITTRASPIFHFSNIAWTYWQVKVFVIILTIYYCRASFLEGVKKLRTPNLSKHSHTSRLMVSKCTNHLHGSTINVCLNV